MEQAALAGHKAASAPTIRALSTAWKGPRFQQDSTAWAAAYAEDVTDLCAILQFIEAAALHEAAEVVNCLGTRWSKTNYSITSMTRSYEETDELAPKNGKPARSDSNPWAHATIGSCAEYWNQTPIPRIAIAMSAPRYKPAESALDSLAFDGDLCREDG